MQVSSKGFDHYGLTIVHNDVDGFFAVKYDEPPKPAEPKLYEDCYNWKHRSEGNCYTLVVPKPEQRKVTCCVVIHHTSINRYEVTFASVLECEFTICKSMNAVHEFLAPLLGGKQ